MWRGLVFAAAAALIFAAAAVPATKPVAFFGCRAIGPSPAPLVRPTSIIVACADANFYLAGIRWTSWTRAGAAATATANDCTPNCAAGYFHAYRADITLSKPRTFKRRIVFIHIGWRFLGPKPAGNNRSDGLDFPCETRPFGRGVARPVPTPNDVTRLQRFVHRSSRPGARSPRLAQLVHQDPRQTRRFRTRRCETSPHAKPG